MLKSLTQLAKIQINEWYVRVACLVVGFLLCVCLCKPQIISETTTYIPDTPPTPRDTLIIREGIPYPVKVTTFPPTKDYKLEVFHEKGVVFGYRIDRIKPTQPMFKVFLMADVFPQDIEDSRITAGILIKGKVGPIIELGRDIEGNVKYRIGVRLCL